MEQDQEKDALEQVKLAPLPQDNDAQEQVKLAPLPQDKACATCGSPGELFSCSSCQKVYYCNVKCQRKDWKSHKPVCSKAPQPAQAAQPKAPLKPVFTNIGDFLDLTNIGSGNFTKILKGKWKQTGKDYAIKMVSKADLDRLNKHADVFMEKHALGLLQEESAVVNIHATFQDDKHLYLVMDYLPKGELWAECKQFGLANTHLIRYYLSHIVQAVRQVHSKGLVHRDLKPENVMLDQNSRPVLIDFGTARDIHRPEIKGSGNGHKGKKTFDHFVGTPNFMAPEQIRNRDSTYKSDVWALGSLACQLVTGFPAFVGGSDYLIFKQIVDLEEGQEFLPLPSQVFPQGLEEWVRFVMVRDIEQRPTLEEAMAHPYFQEQALPIEECLMSPGDQLVQECRQEVTRQMKMNREILDSLIESYLAKTQALPQDSARTQARLHLLSKQMRHYYKMEEYKYVQEAL